jgi:nucleotide-binding universal stress UspA family protein
VTVVVAYDGGDASREALLWALTQTPGDERIVPVAALGHEPSPLPLLSRLPGVPDEIARAARRIAPRWDEDGRDLRDFAELSFERGHPAEVLARVAAREDADLIVLGHPREGWSMRPSTAEELIRRAPCPVMVLP